MPLNGNPAIAEEQSSVGGSPRFSSTSIKAQMMNKGLAEKNMVLRAALEKTGHERPEEVHVSARMS
jgi:hypothetical protein